jgi:exopolysaccharide biosynthesis polyprenyl glycosylphosphotransferase
MQARNTKYYSLILVIADFLVLLSAFSIAYILRVQMDDRPLINEVFAVDYVMSVLVIIPFWIVILGFIGLYNADVYTRRLREWSRIAVGVTIGILLVIGWQYVFEKTLFPARLVVAYALVISFLLLLIEREFLRFTRSMLFRFGKGISHVLIIGNSSATRDITRELSDTVRSGYRIVALASPKRLAPIETGIKHFSSVDEALDAISHLGITTIIQTDLYQDSDRNQRILAAAQSRHIQYNFIPGESEFYAGKNTVDVFLGYPMITVHQTPLTGWGEIIKRVFDSIVSLILLILLAPIFVLIIILQMILNPGPIFYISKRLSKFSDPISLIKFRSMNPRYGKRDAALEFEEMGRADLAREYRKHRKVVDDPRITKFGHFLRDTSLDELPQLINVLKGDLSLVGPRPILPQEVHYAKSRTALLHSVRSGVTGLWQVSGRSNLSFEERIELELYYARNWSFWMDIKILIKTIGVVLRRTGAK